MSGQWSWLTLKGNFYWNSPHVGTNASGGESYLPYIRIMDTWVTDFATATTMVNVSWYGINLSHYLAWANKNLTIIDTNTLRIRCTNHIKFEHAAHIFPNKTHSAYIVNCWAGDINDEVCPTKTVHMSLWNIKVLMSNNVDTVNEYQPTLNMVNADYRWNVRFYNTTIQEAKESVNEVEQKNIWWTVYNKWCHIRNVIAKFATVLFEDVQIKWLFTAHYETNCLFQLIDSANAILWSARVGFKKL